MMNRTVKKDSPSCVSIVSKSLLIVSLLVLFAQTRILHAMGLDEAVSTALRQSPLLGEKVHERKEAEEAARAARGEFLPRVDAQVSAQRLSDPSAVVPIKSFGGSPPFFSRDLYSATVDLTYPVYSGGRIQARAASAGFERSASLRRETRVAQALVADVKTAFYRILALKEQVRATRESRDAAARLRDDARKRLEAGDLAPVDLLRIETRLEQEEQILTQARAGLERARNAFRAILGADGPVDAQGDLAEPAPVDTAEEGEEIETLVEGREDVKAAAAEVSREAENIRVERAGLLPSLDLVGEYGRKAGSGLDEDEEVWSAGLRIRQNIFDGGIVRHRARGAEARHEAARERLRQTRLAARREILDAFSLIGELRARLSAARMAEKTASEAYRLERTRYLNGLSSTSDTLLAHADLLRAQSDVISALADLNAAVISYEFATGKTVVPGNGE